MNKEFKIKVGAGEQLIKKEIIHVDRGFVLDRMIERMRGEKTTVAYFTSA